MPEKILMLLGNDFTSDARVYNEARAIVRHGWSVDLLGWDRDGRVPLHENIDGIDVTRILVRSTHGRGITQVFFLLVFFLKASCRILRSKCSLIYCHDFEMLPLGYFCARMKEVPVVYDSHESYPDMLSGSLPPWAVKFLRTAERWYLRRLPLVITVGERLARRIRSDGAANVVVVGNWKDPVEFRVAPDEAQKIRQELRIPAGSLVVAFIAHLNPERKIIELIESVKCLPGVFLLVGGPGPLTARVRQYEAEASNIRFIGPVPPRLVPYYTSVADVIYYGFEGDNPNAFYSAPNKLFEAVAGGKVLLTGSFGEIGEIVEKYGIGVILPSYEPETIRQALSKLKEDGLLLRQMKGRAVELANSRYNLAIAERELLRALSSLTGSAGLHTSAEHDRLSSDAREAAAAGKVACDKQQ